MVSFHLPIIPPKATSQGAGKRIAVINGRPMFFKNQKAVSAEHDLLMLCAPHTPQERLEGPVVLDVEFVWPWRKSEPKRRLAMGRAHHTSKPDCSNIIKQLEDVLTKLQFWTDDGQVADLRVSKFWGDTPGIRVSIAELDPAPAGRASLIPQTKP